MFCESKHGLIAPRLIEGVHRFHSQHFHHRRSFVREERAFGCPRVLAVTCSDLGIGHEELSQGREVDLLVLRSPGNVVYQGMTSTPGFPGELETWLEGCDEVILCGHSRCKVLECAIGSKGNEGLPHAIAAAWVDRTGQTLKIVHDHYRSLREEELLEMAICENVLVQLENLQGLPGLAGRLARGEVRLHGWIYDSDSHEFWCYDPEVSRFLPLASGESRFAEPWNHHMTEAKVSVAS